MKITGLVAKVITRQPDVLLRNPRSIWREKRALIVFLETDTGLVGIGEAWCEGSDPASTVAVLKRDLEPLIVGEDPFFIGRIWDRLFELTIVSAKQGIVFAAMSAIDIATWDLIGKTLAQPTYKLLGARREKVFAYASGGLYQEGQTPDDLAADMAACVAQGFRAVKIKVGGTTLSEDIARVAAVRKAIGPQIRLMVDAVYSLSVPQAIKMARALEPYDLWFFEAPVSPYDIEGLAKVNAMSGIPIAGNEFAFGRHAFRELIERDAVSFVHLDTILCGGISEAMRIAAMASAREFACSFHASSSAVCFASNLHIAAAISNCDSIEWHMVHRLLFDRLPEDTFRLQDGYVRMPDAPGLGIAIDPHAI